MINKYILILFAFLSLSYSQDKLNLLTIAIDNSGYPSLNTLSDAEDITSYYRKYLPEFIFTETHITDENLKNSDFKNILAAYNEKSDSNISIIFMINGWGYENGNVTLLNKTQNTISPEYIINFADLLNTRKLIFFIINPVTSPSLDKSLTRFKKINNILPDNKNIIYFHCANDDFSALTSSIAKTIKTINSTYKESNTNISYDKYCSILNENLVKLSQPFAIYSIEN